jgi:putative transposase
MELPDNKPQPRTNKHLGLDWGLKTYLTGFDGNDLITADFDEDILKSLDKRINLYQKQLARKVVNSKRYWKATTKLQQAYLNFNNYRHDEIKKIVCYINRTYDTVSIEKLNMKFAIKNKHLSKRVHQKPYYLFKETLVNKFNQFNKDVYYVPKDYPSTQICSNCGNRKMDDDKVKLGESVYKCSKCGTVIDRDENAARNIYTYRNLEKVILN